MDSPINNADQAIIKAFDQPSQTLKTTLVNAAVDINVSAFTDSIKIGDGTGSTATITQIGPKKALDVNVADIAISHQADSIRLGDGTNYLTSTTSGGKTALDVSINGGTVSQAPSGTTTLVYATTNVAAGSTGTIINYSVPAGVYIQKIYLSGTSIGKYTVKKNGTPQMIYRMSQTQFSTTLDLATSTAWGLQTVISDIISVTVENAGTQAADFDVTLQNLQT